MNAWVFVISFVVIAAAVVGMALGFILGGRRLQGSCGGLANVPGTTGGCPACPRKRGRKAQAAAPRADRMTREAEACRGADSCEG